MLQPLQAVAFGVALFLTLSTMLVRKAAVKDLPQTIMIGLLEDTGTRNALEEVARSEVGHLFKLNPPFHCLSDNALDELISFSFVRDGRFFATDGAILLIETFVAHCGFNGFILAMYSAFYFSEPINRVDRAAFDRRYTNFVQLSHFSGMWLAHKASKNADTLISWLQVLHLRHMIMRKLKPEKFATSSYAIPSVEHGFIYHFFVRHSLDARGSWLVACEWCRVKEFSDKATFSYSPQAEAEVARECWHGVGHGLFFSAWSKTSTFKPFSLSREHAANISFDVPLTAIRVCVLASTALICNACKQGVYHSFFTVAHLDSDMYRLCEKFANDPLCFRMYLANGMLSNNPPLLGATSIYMDRHSIPSRGLNAPVQDQHWMNVASWLRAQKPGCFKLALKSGIKACTDAFDLKIRAYVLLVTNGSALIDDQMIVNFS